MANIIKTKDHIRMPWSNGLGITSQIAIEPPTSSFSKLNFTWRLSSTRIEDSNEFSVFKTYDRLLVVTEGQGLFLNDNYLAPLSPFAFAGEEKIQCRLKEGPVTDIGLIYHRDRCRAGASLLLLTSGTKHPLVYTPGLSHLLTVVEGKIEFGDEIVHQGETLIVSNSAKAVSGQTQKMGQALDTVKISSSSGATVIYFRCQELADRTTKH